jgi:hypothetical protein
MLRGAQVRRFIEDGFVRIDGAFSREIADKARAAIWQAIGCDPDDPTTWARPVVRIGTVNDEHGVQPLSFREAPPTLQDSMTRSTSWSDGGAGDAAPMWVRSSYASPAGRPGRPWVARRFQLSRRDRRSHRKRLLGLAGQCYVAGPRAAHAVPVLRRWRRRRADAHPGRLSRRCGAPSRPRRRGWASAPGTGRRGGGPGRGARDRRGWHRLLMPPLPDPRCPDSPRQEPAGHIPAASGASGTVPARPCVELIRLSRSQFGARCKASKGVPEFACDRPPQRSALGSKLSVLRRGREGPESALSRRYLAPQRMRRIIPSGYHPRMPRPAYPF